MLFFRLEATWSWWRTSDPWLYCGNVWSTYRKLDYCHRNRRLGFYQILHGLIMEMYKNRKLTWFFPDLDFWLKEKFRKMINSIWTSKFSKKSHLQNFDDSIENLFAKFHISFCKIREKRPNFCWPSLEMLIKCSKFVGNKKYTYLIFKKNVFFNKHKNQHLTIQETSVDLFWTIFYAELCTG